MATTDFSTINIDWLDTWSYFPPDEEDAPAAISSPVSSAATPPYEFNSIDDWFDAYLSSSSEDESSGQSTCNSDLDCTTDDDVSSCQYDLGSNLNYSFGADSSHDASDAFSMSSEDYRDDADVELREMPLLGSIRISGDVHVHSLYSSRARPQWLRDGLHRSVSRRQQDELLKEFRQSPNPSTKRMRELANSLGMTFSTVNTWFFDRRCVMRRARQGLSLRHDPCIPSVEAFGAPRRSS
ncbi:uncharacterized protein LOC100373992 [Saccoglossus kowalevskii]|uniref:Uncharacterized protein LOC100373992 n=1 Tax=Saccoglossus kowalevskii TaxID=10224 RepID=A0ABM0H0Z8_SACKO|nr:PREDICTED: uncharacterized protein LOC100373992 [Saccoglossus kowalevskii]